MAVTVALGLYGNELAVFFHLHTVSKSLAEFSTLIGAFMGLWSHAPFSKSGPSYNKIKTMQQKCSQTTRGQTFPKNSYKHQMNVL